MNFESPWVRIIWPCLLVLPVLGQAAEVAEPTGQALRQFREDWRAGNHDLADLFAEQRMAPGAQITGLSSVLKYMVFERGRCGFDESDTRVVEVFKHDPAIQAGAIVCRAVGGNFNDAQSRDALAEIRELDGSGRRIHVYDLFARQPTINRAALQWLRRYDRFDPLPSGGSNKNALVEQILAGRAGNVRRLLEEGYDANQAILDPYGWGSGAADGRSRPARRGLLPLAAARQSLGSLGQVAIEITRLLLEAGADPYKLAWYPAAEDKVQPVAAPELIEEFDAVLDAHRSRHAPLGAEFIGLRSESSPTGTHVYARFLMGNGGTAVKRIPAWSSQGLWRLDGLPVGSELTRQEPGSRSWKSSLLIAHGWSPATRISLKQGESVEVLYDWSLSTEMQYEPGTRYRLQVRLPDGDLFTEPFDPYFPKEKILWMSIPAERDWFGSQ